MPEPTSIDSYRQAHESGLIGQRQMEVLAFVIANEPCNQGDVSRHFADASSSYQPRFRELEDAGVIEQRGTKVDPGTSRVVKAYVATGKIPTEPVRRKRRKFRATLERPATDCFASAKAEAKGEHVITIGNIRRDHCANPRSTMQKIVKRAGLQNWPKLFHNFGKRRF